MAYYFLVCEEKKDEHSVSGTPVFLIALARDVFPEYSVENMITAVHQFAGGIHPTRCFYASNLWTEEKVKKLFPDISIEYSNSPEEFANLKERLLSEGWKWPKAEWKFIADEDYPELPAALPEESMNALLLADTQVRVPAASGCYDHRYENQEWCVSEDRPGTLFLIVFTIFADIALVVEACINLAATIKNLFSRAYRRMS